MKVEIDHIIMGALFALLLFLGPGAILNHELSHSSPYGYGASDAFQHQVRADAIRDMGNFRYEASYISSGIEGAVGRYPPGLYHIAIILSSASGLAVYDAIAFLVLFFMLAAILIFALLIRDYSKTLSLLFIPLAGIIFSYPPIMGYYYGHWPSVLAQTFLILFFWSVLRIDLPLSPLLIGSSLAAILLTHTSEGVFAGLFLALFLLSKSISSELSKSLLLKLAMGIGIALAISFSYLIIFMNTWAKGQPYSFTVEPIWNGNPGFYLLGFGLLLVPLLIGALYWFFNFRKIPVVFIAGFSMLIAGHLNYIGFGLRAFQIRFFWPLYLGCFIALGIYLAIKFLPKQFAKLTSFGVIILLAILIWPKNDPAILFGSENGAVPYVSSISKGFGNGIMDPYHWEALSWISANTPLDSQVYFFYGDIYSQDALLRNAKREHFQADPENFVAALQSRTIQRFYVSERPGDTGGLMSKRTGLFSFTDAVREKPSSYFFGPMDICTFDYWVFDKASRQEVLAQYNLLIANTLLQNGFASVAFQNDVVIVMKNNKKGGECIAEQSF